VPLSLFHPAVAEWFDASFGEPTAPQALGWPAIARGESTLVLSPTGSGKTLAAFLWAIDRVMFSPLPERDRRCRVLYVSPLKALAVDVERNLRSPIAGITVAAQRRGDEFNVPAVLVRTGDTPAAERARFLRDPADILITTPESLYLLLTSRAREVLRSIETVIVDEIHALVPTKRGAHLALSLERLHALCGRPLQRIGLSATQRPLDEVARFLGGAERRPVASAGGEPVPGAPDLGLHDEGAVAAPEVTYRPVTIVDSRQPKRLSLSVEVPVEDLAKLARPQEIPSGPAAQGPTTPSIWSSIHPRLLELVRAHRTTLLFANSRRLAERLAGALNELAGETVARAHHGSLAREQRLEIEDALKAGRIPAIVATSSLELGIDMGAVDLVIQIEAPPSVASGMQRIGRASHQVDAVSEGIIFPKFRGDLVACAAVTRAMHEGQVEATRYPRNPLDVLAQQLVAMVGVEPWAVDDLLATVRCAAPFAGLSRAIFEGVLDMLSGRYPSDEFAELRPRLTWDRIAGTLTARQGAARVAIVNGGTIPDRGLYGVFLAGATRGSARVGELDEEMVFESRPGETFVLGATTWRIEEITHDRVLVSPASGEPGKMPFWKGDRPGRPLELGLAVGRLVREIVDTPRPAALARLTRDHALEPVAAENLLRYLDDQRLATQAVPDDRTIVIERCRDELGDWRVCLLAPFGSQVLAPWAMIAEARVRERLTYIIPLTLFLVLLLLYLNTKSITKTAIVSLAVPFSAIGAVWYLYLLDYNMSIAVWVGLIALMGVDAETGVFMLLYLDLSYEEAKKQGRLTSLAALQETIVHGAAKRLRPKFMTMATTCIGFVPIMLATGTGSDVWKRIAAPMIGGILTSFLLELIVYPAIYEIWKWHSEVKHSSQPAAGSWQPAENV